MRRLRLALAVLAALSAAAFATTWVRSRPIAEAPPHARAVPSLDALPKVDLCWLEYARRETPGRVAMAGFSPKPTWNVTVSGLLVRHPKGDVVIDLGFSSRYDAEIAEYPFFRRVWLGLIRSETVRSTPDAIRFAGADPERLAWAIPSHAHIDHAGGVVDLPHAPVLLPQEEIDFITKYRDQKETKVVPAHARALDGRMTAMRFTKVPYETFDESADIFGDGSIVAVKLAGHTPGSVGIFVNVSKEKRIFYVGDTVNVMEAIDLRRTKSFVMSSTDDDAPSADAIVARLAQFHAAVPEVSILPAHDRDQWVHIFGGHEPRCASSAR